MNALAKFILLGACAVPAFGAATTDVEALMQLDQTEASWLRNAPKDYDYELMIGGVFTGAIHKVTSRGYSCRSSWRTSRNVRDVVWKREECDGQLVKSIHAQLRRALQIGTGRVEVSFNAKYGYVEYLSLDPGG